MPTIGGFSRTQIIEIAQRRTEKRGESLDMGGEFILALQEVCLETRWWWRRKTATVTFRAGTVTYDLTDPAGINAPDYHQAAHKAVRVYNTTASGAVGCAVSPVFSPDEQDAILALRSSQVAAAPSAYFVRWPNLILDVPPDRDYPGSIGYWAIPNYTDDSAEETIPLVPSYAHGLIIKRLEIHIERFALGEGSDKYKAVMGEYEEMVERQQLYNRFADGQIKDIRNAVHGDAVQSS